MEKEEIRHRLLGVTALAARYCATVENASEAEQREFVASMLQLLPRIYVEFNDLVPGRMKKHQQEIGQESDNHEVETEESDPLDEYATVDLEEEDEHPYYGSYVDEDYYENVRRHMETLLGPDDVFLETFEEDMKYSDTPIAASISECLADIFQPLYNFISIVKESEGRELEGAYRECHDNFVGYWSQTLCNVLRALNNLFYNQRSSENADY